MEDFNIDEKNGLSTTTLYLEGYLDAHTSVELEKRFEKLISEDKVRVVVNFKNLSYISSAGLGVFMAYIESVRDKSGDIKLCEMNEKIFNIFEMLGFPLLFEIYNEEITAIEKFA